MKKLFVFTLVTSIIVLICSIGCSTRSDGTEEWTGIKESDNKDSTSYSINIKARVISNDTYQWFATTYHYRQNIIVCSDEYGIKKEFDFNESGAFGLPKYYYSKQGDYIDAEMYVNSDGKKEIECLI